jgi:putative two-component system response regulator
MTTPRVLIVDDDHTLRQELSKTALYAGFHVDTAKNGQDALARARRNTPDIVVTDLHMPQLGGERLVANLRKRLETSRIPILVITSDTSRETKIRLLREGADDFLCKPVDLQEFQARLVALARQASLVDGLETVTQERDNAYMELEERNQELETLTLGLVSSLERANSLNDSDTGHHIQRVSKFSALLAETVGCEPAFVKEVGRYAGLHDVGKVGIRDAILKKPGKLTSDEFREMQDHTLIGEALLKDAKLPEIARDIALCHHERWDGSGYPRGLKGTQIPLAGRIVGVVDVYDALRSKRCYKPAFSWDESVEILRDSCGTHLERRLVEAFLGQRERIMAIEDEHREPIEELVWA